MSQRKQENKNMKKVTLNNTPENKAIIDALKKVNQCQWNGNVVHSNLDKCLRGINLQSNNSGWYNPVAITIPGLSGIYMVNEDGSLYFDARVIKEADNKFRIEYLLTQGYNEFEKLYSNLFENA